ncbi:MAG: hypothetical protein Q7O66_12840, partial [Dehalococcoidia bacterium]|nr:hypothetical protein [Dehalococcoidia bacterium]
IERVERFLRFTDRLPEEVLGRLLPEKREATVWNVAVNGVMSGCRPEYMPILLAIVEAISEPVWRIEDAGSTPGWDPLIIVSGPIVKELNFNFEASAMRVGRQANTSIGRFLRLYMRNIPGMRIAGSNEGKPTYTDKGSIAGGFNVALAENEDAVAAVGWKTFGEERGFDAGKNVVTVQSVVAISPPIYVAGEDPAVMADTIARAWGNGDVAYWSSTGMRYGRWHPLLVMTPAVAQAFARGGWTKDDLRRYLAENVKIPAWLVERYHFEVSGGKIDISPLAEAGIISREYVTSSDPDRLLPVFPWPEWIGIVVAGDPGRNQVKGYTNNHQQSPPVSKEVRLPDNWNRLLDMAR